jgi:hypothetical protein
MTGEVAFAGLAPIRITGVNDAVIQFGGQKRQSMNLKTSKIVYSTRYALKCRPAQRMF